MTTSKKHRSIELEVGVHSASESDHSNTKGNEGNPLIDPKNKQFHPISPTPVDSTLINDQAEIEPLKSSGFPSLTPNISSKQLYEYVETLILDHVFQSNKKINHQQLLDLHSINKTLHQLKYLLIPTQHLTHVQDHKTSYKTPPHKIPVIDEKNNLNNLNNLNNNNKTSPSKTLKWCTHSTRALWQSAGGSFIPSSALLHHQLYSIDVDKHCGVLRGSVRQDWNTIESDDDEYRNWEELKPHWFELFFDLMFVAAIVHISSEVAEAYKHDEYMFILTVFPQFGLLILCWLEQVLYHSRFRMTQTGDALLVFFYMSLVLMMGLSIGNSSYQLSQKLFLVSYMFTKLIMCVMFMKSYFIPRAKAHSVYMIIPNVVSMVAVIFVEIFVNIPTNQYAEKQWIWTVIYWTLFIYSWFHVCVLLYLQCIRNVGINIPINVPHIAERMGAFVLIILGETIISIMVQHVESTKDGIITAYSVTMSFFVIVYCIGKLYFESQPSEHEMHHHQKSHAMSTSVWRARIYKWFHILLFFGLLGLGLGSKITVHELPHYKGDKALYVFLPGISCIIVCICINIIRLTHPFDYSKKHPHFVVGVWLTRILCIICMFGILFTWRIVNHAVILAVYVACFIVQIFVDFEAQHRLIITKAAHKDKSLHYHKSTKLDLDDVDKFDMTVTRTLSFIGAF